MKHKSIAFSVGEASGDLNGAALAQEFKASLGSVDLWGGGGKRMREAGVDLTVDSTGGGTIGVFESLLSLPAVIGRYRKLKREVIKRKPDLFIPIDFGAFNIRLARRIFENNIPVVYYFPPSSWRKRLGNIEGLKACGGKVVTPFPWSAENLCSQGIDARFVGHPLIDIAKPAQDKQKFLKKHGLRSDMPIIGLFPGSRLHEITTHLFPMLEAAKIIDDELRGAQFIIGAAPGMSDIKTSVEKYIKRTSPDLKVEIIENENYDCMAHSDFLITCSGTATLEAAIIGTPMIIIYRGSALMRFEYIFRKAVVEGFIGMPNIIADRMIVPELIGKHVSAHDMAAMVLTIMEDSSWMENIKRDLKETRAKLGESGAVKRAASAILELSGIANSAD